MTGYFLWLCSSGWYDLCGPPGDSVGLHALTWPHSPSLAVSRLVALEKPQLEWLASASNGPSFSSPSRPAHGPSISWRPRSPVGLLT